MSSKGINKYPYLTLVNDRKYYDLQASKGVEVLATMLGCYPLSPQEDNFRPFVIHDGEKKRVVTSLGRYCSKAPDLLGVMCTAAAQVSNLIDGIKPDQRMYYSLALFAASIGYAQTKATELRKIETHMGEFPNLRKHALRDEVLLLGMHIWEQYGYGSLVEYILMQRIAAQS